MSLHVSATFPGPRNPDPYTFTATIRDDELAFPLEFRFVDHGTDTEPDWCCVAFEIKRANSPEPIRDETTREDAPPIPADVLRRVAQHWERYVEIARSAVAFNVTPLTRESVAARQEGQGRRGLTPDFLRLIAEEYAGLVAQGKPAVAEIARAHGVNKSTASRWVAKAREATQEEE